MRTYVNELDLGRVQPGMTAGVRTDSARGKVYAGHVGFISPTAEFTPKTVETRELRTDLVYRLRIVVDNPDGGLRQGMPVTVTFEQGGLCPPSKAYPGGQSLPYEDHMSDDPLAVVEDLTKRFGRGAAPALDRLERQDRARPGHGPGRTRRRRQDDVDAAPGRPPAAGRGAADGLRLRHRSELPAIRRSVSYMPQRFGLYEDLTVIENLNLYADLRGVTGPERRRAFERLLAFTDLARFTDRLAGKLSGGMKQKLGLACA